MHLFDVYGSTKKRDRRCGRGDGDCDKNSDCQPGLICGKNNCHKLLNLGWPYNHYGFIRDTSGKLDNTDDCCCVKGVDPGCTDAGCFSLDSVVTLSSGRSKPMSGLKKGEKVATVNGKREIVFTEFLGWAEKDSSTTTYFLQLTTENRSSVVLTAHHFLMSSPDLAQDPVMKQAGEVTEGDFLLTSSGLEKVSSISRVMRQGRAAPLTMTGDLLVDGVLSSNYAHAPSHSVAHLWMSPFRWLDLLTDEETEGEDIVRRYAKLGSHLGDLITNNKDDLLSGKALSIMNIEILMLSYVFVKK